MTTLQERVDQAAEIATGAISSVTGAVADPKAAAHMAATKSRKAMPVAVAIIAAIVGIVVMMRLRNR
ncbi:MAG TPA: hypothetical protein VFR41_10200 [Acidimicrobiia bacterium]|nr:hypothetical protein [Acidimicrobiia bacterium]